MTGLQHPRGKTRQLQGETENPTILVGALTPSFRADRTNNNKKNEKAKKQITEKICNMLCPTKNLYPDYIKNSNKSQDQQSLKTGKLLEHFNK